MIQNTNEINKYQNNLYDQHDDFLADFGVHKARSLRVSYDRQNLIDSITNQLTAELIEGFTGDTANQKDNFSVEGEANRVLDKYQIIPAADSTFVTTAFASEAFSDDIQVARSYLNLPNARQEIHRIANRFNSDDWQIWLRQTAIEAAQAVCQDFSLFSLQHQYDCLAFTCDELKQLLRRLSARRNDCVEQHARLHEEQQNNRQQQSTQIASEPPNETRGGFVNQIRKKASNWLDLSHYFPGQDISTQKQVGLSDNIDPLESFLAQVEFETIITQTESAFYNDFQETIDNHLRVLEVSLTNLRKTIVELLNSNAKLESKRSFSTAGGEMLLNSSELTSATIQFLASDEFQKNVLLSELREKTGIVIGRCKGDIRDSDMAEMKKIISDGLAEKLSDFYIADAMAALLQFQPNFETQLHDAIRQTAATDFLSTGWYQFLTPKLNYFAAVGYLQSVFEETNARLSEVIERITASLHLNYENKNESFDSNYEDFCFYIEYFCLPVESFEFYEQNISEFEKIKDLPNYNPHSDLYSDMEV